MLEQLGSIEAEIEAEHMIRVVIIRGHGRSFCTGGDIEAWGALSPHDMARKWILRGIEVFDRLLRCRNPSSQRFLVTRWVAALNWPWRLILALQFSVQSWVYLK
jgi:hypothetical protein